MSEWSSSRDRDKIFLRDTIFTLLANLFNSNYTIAITLQNAPSPTWLSCVFCFHFQIAKVTFLNFPTSLSLISIFFSRVTWLMLVLTSKMLLHNWELKNNHNITCEWYTQKECWKFRRHVWARARQPRIRTHMHRRPMHDANASAVAIPCFICCVYSLYLVQSGVPQGYFSIPIECPKFRTYL